MGSPRAYASRVLSKPDARFDGGCCGIHVAEYVTALPPRAVLAERLHQATRRAQLQIERRQDGDKKS